MSDSCVPGNFSSTRPVAEPAGAAGCITGPSRPEEAQPRESPQASASGSTNSARTPREGAPPACPSCDVLSRQYGLVIEQNAALAARNRALEATIVRLVVSGEQVRAGLAGLQRAAGS